jgi:hypothetical protein
MDLLKRRNERSSSNISAVIRTEDASFSAACVVRNLSEGGAKLIINEQRQLPSEFILFLRPNSPVGRRCQVMWQVGKKVGIRFDSVAEFSKGTLKGSGVWAPG